MPPSTQPLPDDSAGPWAGPQPDLDRGVRLAGSADVTSDGVVPGGVVDGVGSGGQEALTAVLGDDRHSGDMFVGFQLDVEVGLNERLSEGPDAVEGGGVRAAQ